MAKLKSTSFRCGIAGESEVSGIVFPGWTIVKRLFRLLRRADDSKATRTTFPMTFSAADRHFLLVYLGL